MKVTWSISGTGAGPWTFPSFTAVVTELGDAESSVELEDEVIDISQQASTIVGGREHAQGKARSVTMIECGGDRYLNAAAVILYDADGNQLGASADHPLFVKVVT